MVKVWLVKIRDLMIWLIRLDKNRENILIQLLVNIKKQIFMDQIDNFHQQKIHITI